ncbi:putative ribonuclease H protein [Vitis vinifera]|uniref:Putative ribonuclease H protein n=1 Tax=Vitis vinifera TaxID=29760 RepID=A0A438GEF3_VITVI|nr:putative ribonuclease H protein [Vitis vinifera]
MKATMVERKRGISSWVKLGPVSLGLFLECLLLCLEEKSEEKWEKRWEENGRSYSLLRDANKGGCYLRLGVVDLESKRFSIFIPKGRGVKGGWSLMAKTLCNLGVVMDRKERQQLDVRLSEPDLRKSFAEVEQTPRSKGKAVAKVKIRKEALSSNLNKLTHCLVGFWNPNSVRGDDLKGWGTQMASMWGLRGKLGLAKLERGKILLEFERLEEARKALKAGKVLVGGTSLRVEEWSPETGCVMEGEARSEAWVRIVGLLVSLWDRDILKRVNGDELPRAVEIWVDERCYVLTLWWEIKPLLRIFPTDQSGKKAAVDVEVGGEAVTRAGKRVVEEGNDTSYEVMIQSADGMQCQSSGSGRPLGPIRGHDGMLGQTSGGGPVLGGSSKKGPVEVPFPSPDDLAFGSFGPGPFSLSVAGPSSYGLCTRMAHGQTKDSGINVDLGLVRGQYHSGPGGKAQVGETSSLVRVDPNVVGRPVSESSIFWEKDDLRKQFEKESQAMEKSKTDLALIEEASRYGNALNFKGTLVSGLSPPFCFFHGRTPEREYYDYSGAVCEAGQGETPLCMLNASGLTEGKTVSRWELVEANNGCSIVSGAELRPVQPKPHEGSDWEEASWEESDLTRFSNFLGFSTEGLEKEIMDFLGWWQARKRVSNIRSPMKLRLLSWNVRGANDSSKRKVIKALIRSQRVDVFCLQETKIQAMSEGVVRSLGTGRFLGWGALEASGSAGGILVCWDRRTLDVLDVEVGQFSISCRVRNVEDGFCWMFTGVYGPFSREERECLWEELGAIRGERSRQGRTTGAMRRFAQMVDEFELTDLPLQGGRCTWNGGRGSQSWARLDRFLVTQNWLDHFSGVVQSRLPRPTSDHFPILLECGGLRRGPSPFRFENMWLKVVGFKNLLRGWWQETVVRGTASFRLASKLKELKKKIKVWNREVFGRLEVNKNLALHQVEHWDGVESERILSERETELKKEAKENYQKWVLLEELHWRQLSRELWLKEGDRNTGYFHRMANAHRRNNTLDRIKINGVWLSEEQEVKEGIVNVFQQLLSEESGWKADIEGLHLSHLSSQEAGNLELPFSEDEIHSALLEMDGDKAPGPDGLKKVLGRVVSLDQNAFVKGRQILDASLIANEVIDAWQKRKEKGLICKLDIEKAYDSSISWDFLMKILRKLGFGSRWMEWIWWCISTAKFSVLVNGVPAGFFSSTKGLRQGDPLSPYLFVLGMEVLSALLRRAAVGGFVSGCRFWGRGRMELNISHLLFADDTIIFCEARKENMTFLSWILAWFEAASGLRINLAKSELIPVGEVEEIEEMAVELGCRVGSLPNAYLGLPLGVPHKASSMWDGVEEKMRRRLALWKRQYISKGGRVTLIKSTLASMPIYQLSLFRMPKMVARRLEKLQRDFLWGGGSLERKVHLINWEAVCAQKEKGGLGIRRIARLNKVLLGKWLWRFAFEEDKLWKKVIMEKFGQEGLGWRTNEARGTFGVGVWKEILKEADWCWDNIEFKVGKGTKVRFWTDHWCGNAALSQTFPLLFELAAHRNATVNEVWDPSFGQGSWNISFSRDFNDWEVDLVGNLLYMLRDYKISSEEDSVLWKGGGSGTFRVKEAYNLLVASNDIVFPNKGIWVDKVPTKVVFFAWEATWGKVLTLDRLQRRGWQFPNRCFFVWV